MPLAIELLDAKGALYSASNPIPVLISGGGGGTVSQGAAGKDPWLVADGSGFLATGAKQDVGNTSLATIAGQLDTKTSVLATKALQGAGLPAALVGGKLDVNLGTSSITLSVSGPLTDTQLRATAVPISAAALPLPSGAAKDSTLTDGTQRVGGTVAISAAALPLPSGAATVAKQPALGTAGTPSTDVISVQGVVGGVAQLVTANIGTIGVLATANNQTTMLNDGVRSAAIKAASTAVAAADTAVVVNVSPNGPLLVAQSSTTSGQVGPLVQYAATTSNADYGGLSGKTVPLNGDLLGNLRTVGAYQGDTATAPMTTNTTTTLRTGGGILRRLIITTPGVTSTVTLYDNTTSTGTSLGVWSTTTQGSFEINARLATGLTAVTTGGTPANLLFTTSN